MWHAWSSTRTFALFVWFGGFVDFGVALGCLELIVKVQYWLVGAFKLIAMVKLVWDNHIVIIMVNAQLNSPIDVRHV